MIGVTDNESGRAIALVILGIVAVIAIVGLVLLFTGAKKAAVGEFALPAPKSYGGAIKQVQFPYSREFVGKAAYPAGKSTYYSGAEGTYSASGVPPENVGTSATFGNTNEPYVTYKRQDNQISTLMGGNCALLTNGEYPVEASWQQAQATMAKGLKCVSQIEDMYGNLASVSYINGNDACCQASTI
ncbi:hypothetical protein DRJ25_02410 [Candidatus Woesearchaeota archaeon]|nr:MAG: hypothetical protein DRJ25_02410 [Candidatus Woesearchaeota archaeon]